MRKSAAVALLAVTLAPLALAQMPAPAATQAPDAGVVTQFSGFDEATRNFAMTCLAHVFSHVDLHQKYDHSKDALRYDAAQAAPFLEGHTGAVWGMRGHASNYAVVLLDGGICSLDTQSPVAGVWKNFEAMLGLFFPGVELVPVSQAMAGPDTATTKSKGYRLRTQGEMLPPVFTLTVSSDPNVHFADRLTIYFPPSAPQP